MSYAVAAMPTFIWSAFLVIFPDPNKQLFNVRSVFSFLNFGFSLYEIYRFITFTFLGIEVLFFVNKCLLNFMSGNKRKLVQNCCLI